MLTSHVLDHATHHPMSTPLLTHPTRSRPASLVLLSAALCLALWATYAGASWIEPWMPALEQLAGSGAEGAALYALAYHLTTLLLLPPTPLVVCGGAIWGLARGAILVHLISLSADMVPFLIARHLLSRPLRARTAPARLQRLDSVMGADGLKIVALWRWCPLAPYSLMNYLLGLTSVSARDYLLATAIATIPNTVALVYLGALVTPQRRPDAPGWLLALGVVGGLASLIGLSRYARRLLEAEESAP